MSVTVGTWDLNATDGKDGHGLKLEKVGQFFQVLMLWLQKSTKTLWG